ncbi:hypothetical protein L195_g064389, partial [Trifolium pratense]
TQESPHKCEFFHPIVDPIPGSTPAPHQAEPQLSLVGKSGELGGNNESNAPRPQERDTTSPPKTSRN